MRVRGGHRLWITPETDEVYYPDGNVSYETYVCKHMVELETLSPVGTVAPGCSMEYKEHWRLKKAN